MTFDDLNLIEPIAKALTKAGYVTPTPIQSQAIPYLLEGHDLLGCAQTGTGKTAAFSIPIIQHIYKNRHSSPRGIKALILTPTRELAIQIDESFATYGEFTGLRHTVIFGGVGQKPQVDAIKAGVDVLIATPGRLIDLVGQRHINLSKLEFFVLDEADHMLDMGFIHDIRRILPMLPQRRQSLFFSATMPKEIERLANSILTRPRKVEVTPPSSTVDRIEQYLYYVEQKNELLVELLQNPEMESTLVFTRTKYGADKVAKILNRAGITAEAIHGNKSQNNRQRTLANFKERKTRVLIATDIASRGIDVDNLSHVVNFELPNVPETYVHRIGRTGRAGREGVAYSFCKEEEMPLLRDIEKLIGKRIEVAGGTPFTTTAAPKADKAEKKEPKRTPSVRKNAATQKQGSAPSRQGNSNRPSANRRRKDSRYRG
ncbi:MAG: DEAD/DEAH box helicase [Rikenellaceae bacterium]